MVYLLYQHIRISKTKTQQFNKVIMKMIPEPKPIPFDLSKDVDNNFKHETDSVIKRNEFYVIVVQIKTWKRYS